MTSNKFSILKLFQYSSCINDCVSEDQTINSVSDYDNPRYVYEKRLRYICRKSGNLASLIEFIHENPQFDIKTVKYYYKLESFDEYYNSNVRTGYYFYHTPLTLAITNGFTGLVSYMTQRYSMDINDESSNEKGKVVIPLLHFACKSNDIAMVSYLINHGSNINDVTKFDGLEITALHLSAYNGFIHVVNILLMYNAKTDVRDKKGRTAKDWALLGKQKNIANTITNMK